MDELDEEQQSLWLLTFAPAAWFAQFLLSYVTVSIRCSRYAGSGPAAGAETGLGWSHLLIAVYTVAALIVIVLVGLEGYRRHTYGHASPPHDFDTPEDRHRFLGFSTLLLAGLSAVAALWVGGSAFFFATCR